MRQSQAESAKPHSSSQHSLAPVGTKLLFTEGVNVLIWIIILWHVGVFLTSQGYVFCIVKSHVKSWILAFLTLCKVLAGNTGALFMWNVSSSLVMVDSFASSSPNHVTFWFLWMLWLWMLWTKHCMLWYWMYIYLLNDLLHTLYTSDKLLKWAKQSILCII